MTRKNESIRVELRTGRFDTIALHQRVLRGPLLTGVLTSVLVFLASGADAPSLESGLRVGEVANPFAVRAVTGPYRGKTLCYRCKLGNSPVICIFARRITKPLTGLLEALDARIESEKDGLKALVIVLTEDAEKTVAGLETLAERRALTRVPLTLISNTHGPQDYKIADQAEVTILMWKGATVRFNRAFPVGKMTDADVDNILRGLPKVMRD